jgi:hypothetical protein
LCLPAGRNDTFSGKGIPMDSIPLIASSTASVHPAADFLIAVQLYVLGDASSNEGF